MRMHLSSPLSCLVSVDCRIRHTSRSSHSVLLSYIVLMVSLKRDKDLQLCYMNRSLADSVKVLAGKLVCLFCVQMVGVCV